MSDFDPFLIKVNVKYLTIAYQVKQIIVNPAPNNMAISDDQLTRNISTKWHRLFLPLTTSGERNCKFARFFQMYEAV